MGDTLKEIRKALHEGGVIVPQAEILGSILDVVEGLHGRVTDLENTTKKKDEKEE